jgi:hypothetical protein
MAMTLGLFGLMNQISHYIKILIANVRMAAAATLHS